MYIPKKLHCVLCSKELTGRKRKFCSPECDKKHHYSKFKQVYLERIKTWQENNLDRTREIKRESARRLNDYYKPNKCDRCGEYILRGDDRNKRKNCKGCMKLLNNERSKKEQKKYSKTKREFLEDILGDKCIICGFDRSVEFHHINENHGRLKGNISLYYKQLAEGEPLVLLCPNHHVLLHKKLLSITELEKINNFIKHKLYKQLKYEDK